MANEVPVLSAGARLWMEYLKARAERDARLKTEKRVATDPRSDEKPRRIAA